MSYVRYDRLSPELQAEVRALPHWLTESEERLRDFLFWVRADGHISQRGGHHELTEEASQRMMARYYGEVRTKGDLREWKPGVTFHFDRSPS